VAPGHEVVEVESVTIARVGHRSDRFTLMVKVDEAAERAEELDPRS
jgi:hypothetical protein